MILVSSFGVMPPRLFVLTWADEKRKIVGFSSELLKRVFKSSLNELSLYPLHKLISKTSHPAANAASRAMLCFPHPPTPTSIKCPLKWEFRLVSDNSRAFTARKC